jgi:predicted enzyme related to lactoylglutathione lyase
MPNPSRFVWHDLMTSDVPAAVRFYTTLFGWTTKEMKGGPVPYTMISAGGRDIGGMAKLPSPQAPTHWAGYLDVENVDAVCDKAVQMGGKLLMPPQDIPGGGRFAFLSDPQGAVMAPMRPSQPMPERKPNERPAVGTFCWDELMTSDVAAATKFYKTLFHWSATEVDMGQMGTYTLFQRTPGEKGSNAAGMMKKPPEAPVSFWLHYVEVGDVDASARKVKELGGQVHMQPMDIPNIGRFAVCADPMGASFALFKTQH